MCCEDWSRDESDLQNYWQYSDSQAMNCDWFCKDCPEARNHEEDEEHDEHEAHEDCPISPSLCTTEIVGVPLLVILIFMPFCCAPVCCMFCFSRLMPRSPPSSPLPSSPPPSLLVIQPEMPPPPPPMAGATIQSYEDLPPPPAYESS